MDIEKNHRFESIELKESSVFLNKVFTRKEIEYCLAKDNPAPHFAARFSGKESIIKAMTGLGRIIDNYRDIEILNDKDCIPNVFFNGVPNPEILVRLSLSHCEDISIGYALAMEIDIND